MVTDGDWATPYEETVQVTVAREDGHWEFPERDDVTSNLWTRVFKDALNVEVVTDWVSKDYYTKLNLAIASKDLPDVFVVKDVQLQQLMDAGLIADITEVYEEYASDTLKGFMDIEDSIFETAKRDGRLYAIPRLYSGYHPQLLWLRNDWMEQTQKEAPKTVDELEEILLAMQEMSKGVRAFWLDEAEPEFVTYDYENYTYRAGTVEQIGNIYSREFSRLFYEGQKKAGQEEILNLVRCAWAGSQKYGALVWSGDVACHEKPLCKFPLLRILCAVELAAWEFL